MNRARFLLLAGSICLVQMVFMATYQQAQIRSTLSRTTSRAGAFYHQYVRSFWMGDHSQVTLCNPQNNTSGTPKQYYNGNATHVLPGFAVLNFPYALRQGIMTMYVWPFALVCISLFGFAVCYPIAARKGRLPCSQRMPPWAIAGVLWLLIAFSTLWELFSLECFNHPRLFSIPFFLLAVYACRRGWHWLFISSLVSLSLLQEDCGVFPAFYCIYLLIVSEKRAWYLWATLFVSLVAFAVMAFVIQPHWAMTLNGVVERGVELSNSVSAINRIAVFFSSGDELYWLFSLPYFAGWVMGLGVIGGLRKKTLWFLLIVPFPYHISFFLMKNTMLHFIPIFCCLVVATIESLEEMPSARAVWGKLSAFRRAILVGCVLLMAANTALHYRRAYKNMDVVQRNADKIESNNSVLAALAALPDDARITVWVNKPLLGFLAKRNHIWEFPVLFKQTDYIVVQKNADDCEIPTVISAGRAVDFAEFSGLISPRGDYTPDMLKTITGEASGTLTQELTQTQKTHSIYVDSPHVLILKKTIPSAVSIEPESFAGFF